MGDSPIAVLLLLGVVGFFAYQIWKGFKSGASGGSVCKSCGYVGAPESAVRGSLGIEIILWLCFIVPGLIYSIWRQSSYYNACPKCGSKEMIPADSPIGKKIIAELDK